MWSLLQSACSGMAAAVTSVTWVDWALVAIGLFGAIYVLGTWTYDFFERRGVASKRPLLPFLGSTATAFFMIDTFYNIIFDIYNAGKGHSVFGFFEFRRPVFMIRDPEIIKVVTVKEFDHFPNRRSLVSEEADAIFARSVFSLRDQRWREMRATLSPAFTTSKMKTMFPLICECGQQMGNYLQKRYNESAEGAQRKPLTTDLKDLFTRMANDVIATTAFGVRCDSLSQQNNEFYTKGKKLTNIPLWRMVALLGNILFPRVMAKLGVGLFDPEASSFFSKLVLETINERQKKGIYRPDMLQLLMQARAGQLKAEAGDEREEITAEKKHDFTEEDMVAQAGIFFFAGFETVSSALCFAAISLSHEPEVQKRLHEELDGVMKKTGGQLSYESLQELKYLEMVISETLRRYPPLAGVDRVCAKETTLPATATDGPVVIREGDLIGVPSHAIHHDPEYWPDPEKFDPERFSDENKHKIKPFTYFPFGLGPRICIGLRFAMVEMKVALAHMLAHFELKPCPKTVYPIQFAPGFNVSVKGGMWCDLVPRDNHPLANPSV